MPETPDNHTHEGLQTVDIDKVLRDKNPRLHKLLPRFLVSYLRRIAHEDDINHILTNFSGLEPVEFIRSALGYMRISYSSIGAGRLDPADRYIFASNHPFGGLDGLMLAEELTRRFGETKLVVNDMLMNVKPLAPIFIPINKHGRQSGDYARKFREAFASPCQIATFPAGLCSRRINGKIQDPKWKNNFVKMAVDSKRDIVPVYFEGRLSNFFYNLHSARTFLGVKANLEMLYLVDEMFAQGGGNFRMVFGEPVKWEEIAAGGSTEHWCGVIRTKAYNLAEELVQR